MTARPGRIKAVVDVDIPRPRDLQVKRTPRFLELEGTLDHNAVVALPGVGGIEVLAEDGPVSTLRVGLTPCNARVGALPGRGVVDHRLVEIGRDVARVAAEQRRKRARHDAGARRDLQDGERREGGDPPRDPSRAGRVRVRAER